MVNFVTKKLQVFISSTFIDLKIERQAAVEAILTLGHIPAGMELFTAGDESQMDTIKQWINESDIYLLILGGRYGTIEKNSGKSYTQLEYEYATELNMPLFSCVIDESAIEQKVQELGLAGIEQDNPKKLREFRDITTSKLVKFWKDPKDIKIAVSETLSHFARRSELQGWVRPEIQPNLSELVNEITRLSKENSELREQLTTQNSHLPLGIGYHGVLKILQKENLLDFLKSQHEELYSRFGVLTRTHEYNFQKLLALGLIARREDNNSKVSISQDGIAFMNWLKLQGIDQVA